MRRTLSLRLIVCAILLGTASAAHAQQPVVWQYTVVDIPCPMGPACAGLLNTRLTSLGSEGWELVQIVRDLEPGGNPSFPSPAGRMTAVLKKSNIATVVAEYKANAETAKQAITDLKASTLEAIKSGLAPAIKADPPTVAAIAAQIEVTRLTQLEQRIRALEDRRP